MLTKHWTGPYSSLSSDAQLDIYVKHLHYAKLVGYDDWDARDVASKQMALEGYWYFQEAAYRTLAKFAYSPH